MSFLKNKISFSIILAIFSGNAAAALYENDINLHNMSEAESKYSQYKSGNAEDPLETIRKGYSDAYNSEMETSINKQKYEATQEKILSENSRLERYMSSLGASKRNEKKGVYESSLNDDGTLDHEEFSSAYSDYLSNNKSLTEDTLGDRNAFATDVLNDTERLLINYGGSYADNSTVASQNIIDVINADKEDFAQRVKSTLDNAIDDSLAKIPIGLEADVRAAEFDGECGDACDFPVVPPPVAGEGEDDNACIYDDDNYIVEDNSDSSEYGVSNSKQQGISYYYQGTRVYRYQIEGDDSSGRWVNQETETGSTSGFSRGNSVDIMEGGGRFSEYSVEWFEICVD